MPMPALDFGLFIAYLVPGIITVYGLSLVAPQLRTVWRGEGSAPSVGAAVIVTLIALVFGRIVSIGRAAIIDPTFGVPLPLVSCREAPHRGAVRPVAPDYGALTDAGRRESYRLAVANEQRPYQFAGNTAVALLLAAGCWIAAQRRGERRALRMILTILWVLALVVVLYVSARISHYRFARATAVLNGHTFHSLDRAGKPCETAASADDGLGYSDGF